MRPLFLAALVPLALAAPARSQEFAGALAATAASATLKDMEKPGVVRARISLTAPSSGAESAGANPMAGLFSMLGGLMGGSGEGVSGAMSAIFSGVAGPGPDVYYTAGQVVSVAGENFLQVWQVKPNPPALSAINGDSPPTPKPLTAASPLTGALINVRQIAAIRDVRPFRLADELAESAARLKEIEAFSKSQGKDSDAPVKPAPARPKIK